MMLASAIAPVASLTSNASSLSVAASAAAFSPTWRRVAQSLFKSSRRSEAANSSTHCLSATARPGRKAHCTPGDVQMHTRAPATSQRLRALSLGRTAVSRRTLAKPASLSTRDSCAMLRQSESPPSCRLASASKQWCCTFASSRQHSASIAWRRALIAPHCSTSATYLGTGGAAGDACNAGEGNGADGDGDNDDGCDDAGGNAAGALAPRCCKASAASRTICGSVSQNLLIAPISAGAARATPERPRSPPYIARRANAPTASRCTDASFS
mmetsp:Transcript_17520/g.50751  ORF Transcript_17520/g.50751 Transcript_17520/m.50751 type:complete len:270 (-) Transcript_17520:1505-2314(-)